MSHPSIHAAAMPDKVAVRSVNSGDSLTYGELERETIRFANFFRSRGLSRGDAVAIAVGNDLTIFPLIWAGMRCGLYVVPVSSMASPAEVAYLLENSEAKMLVAAPALAERMGGQLPARLESGYVIGAAVGAFTSVEQALAGMSDTPILNPSLGSIMYYSSGTTGRPKGIRRPLPDGAWDGPDVRDATFAQMFRMDEQTVYLSPAPLYHAAPLTFCMIVQRMGGCALVMDRFDAEAALQAIETYRVTHGQWVPTMFARLLSLPDVVRAQYGVSSLEVAVHAAAPCPPSIKSAMIEWWGPILEEFYAGSESAGACYINSEDWLRKPGSVGRPMNCTIHIVGEDGEEAPTGTVGQIYFSGWLAFEYFKDEEKTGKARHPRGWMTLGDMGWVDEDGFLFLADRKDFMILCGGVNIYPREIEDILVRHPAVLEACVVGTPHPDLGEVPVSMMTLVDGQAEYPALKEELKALCAENLARVKQPREMIFADDLPKTDNGKVLKAKVKRHFAAQTA